MRSPVFVTLALFSTLASSASASGKVAVVNLAGEPGIVRARELRAFLAGRGAEAKLSEEVVGVLSGRGRAPEYGGPRLTAVRRAYATFEYVKAEKLLVVETSRALRRARGVALRRALETLFVWRAVVAVARKQSTAAVVFFRFVRGIAPSFELDTARYNPRVQQAFREAASRAPSGGHIVLVGAPTGSRLAIDGKLAPRSNLPSLPVGIHLVEVSKTDHKPHVALVVLRAERPIQLRVELARETRRERVERALRAAEGVEGRRRWERIATLAKRLGVPRAIVITGDRAASSRLVEARSATTSDPIDLARGDRLDRIAELAGLMPPAATTFAATQPASKKRAPFYRRWWFWTAAAAVVVTAAGVATYAVLAPADDVSLVCCE